MSAPQLKLPIQSVHYDAAGLPVESGGEYTLEWLRRNMIYNGSFETWDAGAPVGWDVYVTGDNTVTESADAVFGSKAAKMSKVGSGISHCRITTNSAYRFRVNPTFNYMASAWVKSVNGFTGLNLNFTLIPYDIAGNALTTVNGTIDASGSTYARKYTATFSPVDIPQDTHSAELRLFLFPAATYDVYVDGVWFAKCQSEPLTAIDWDDFIGLNQDSEETFTFPGEPLTGSVFYGEDDPSTEIESINGHLRIEQDRYPRREMSIRLRLTSKESLAQLRRFHAKTRGLIFTYVDHEGASHTVRWRGGFSAPPMQTNTDIYVVTLPLVLATVTDGA